MKKMFAMMLSIVMCLTLSIPAFAADSGKEPIRLEKGESITIGDVTISVKENTEESMPATRAATYYYFRNYEYNSSAYFDRSITCVGSRGNIVTMTLDNGMGQRDIIWQFVALGEVIEAYVEMGDDERIEVNTENPDGFSGDLEWSIYPTDGGTMHFIYNMYQYWG